MVEWKKHKLGDIADVTMGQSPKSEFYNTDKRGVPFCRATELLEENIQHLILGLRR